MECEKCDKVELLIKKTEESKKLHLRNRELEYQLERINSARIYMEDRLVEIQSAIEAAISCTIREEDENTVQA